MSRRKSLLISEIFPPINGGSGRWFWELYSRLPNRDYCILAGESENSPEFDKGHDLKTYRLDMSISNWSSWGILAWSGLKFYWRLIREIVRIVKREDIRVIHCGRCIPEGVAAYVVWKLYGIPYLCFVHGEDVTNAAKSRELTWLVSKVLKHSAKLICNSENSKRVLLTDWSCRPEQIEILNPGVDTNRFVPAPFDIDTRAALGWSDRPVILTVSRLEERKGHDTMIKAMVRVIQEHPNALYAIVGGGDRKHYLQGVVDQLKLQDHVVFMSELSDQEMIKCYQQCDIFALPNRTIGYNIEGFGMVLVEAQSCGKPVIGGNSGGTPETMIINETGFVVDCHGPELLAEQVIKLLHDGDLRSAMGEKGRHHVVSTLDWQAHADKAKAMFQQLADT